MSYNAVGYYFSKEILIVFTPNLKFGDSEKAANFATEYSNIVENYEKLIRNLVNVPSFKYDSDDIV